MKITKQEEIALNEAINYLKNNTQGLPPSMKGKIESINDFSSLKYYAVENIIWFLFEEINDPMKVLFVNTENFYDIEPQFRDGSKYREIPNPNGNGYYNILPGRLTKAAR